MKIAQFPDPHCYYNTYSKIDENKISSRKKEWEKCKDAFINECIKRKVSVATVGGDLFTNSRPTAEQILMIANMER